MTSILRVSAATLLRNGRFNCNAIAAPAAKLSSSTGSDDSHNNGPSKGKETPKSDKDAEATDESKSAASKNSKHDRLLDLLSGLKSETVYKTVKNIETQKPKGYRAVRGPKQRPDPRQTQNIDEAAAQVAESFGGDTDRTKSELLSKLKTKVDIDIADIIGTPRKGKKQVKKAQNEKIDETVTVSTVQKRVVDEAAEKERAEYLAKFKAKSEEKTDVADFVSKLKVEKFDSVRSSKSRGAVDPAKGRRRSDGVEPPTVAETLSKTRDGESPRGRHVPGLSQASPRLHAVFTSEESVIGKVPERRPLRSSDPEKSFGSKLSQVERRYMPPREFSSTKLQTLPYSGSVKLFDGKPLGIFSPDNQEAKDCNSLNIWNAIEKHEFDVFLSRPPNNYYEKMAQWTDQGKIWKFPIDNEQGLDEEAQFSFEQHVFLDQQLEPWCPRTGPVRIFMELVCVGLSKNPYLTVAQKHEHIEWYRNYFDEKKEVLERMVVQQQQQKQEQEKSGTPLIN